MSNIAGKAYAMNVITPVRPYLTWINELIFMVGRAIPATLAGLLGLSIIHFARWVVIKRHQWPNLGQGAPELQNDYVMFCSNFNGTWDQYIDAFSDGIPNGLDLFWYSSTKYPHSIPITPFKRYITHNQLQTGYYYNATPGSAQRDIKGVLRVFFALQKLAPQAEQVDPETFAKLYREALVSVQNDLGDPGLAPVASNATHNAAVNRQPYIDQRWGAGAQTGGAGNA